MTFTAVSYTHLDVYKRQALGDMACHIMDPLYWALDLKYPTSVIGSSTLSNLYSPPHAQIVTYTFPARPPKGNVKMPEVKVYWYDGGSVSYTHLTKFDSAILVYFNYFTLLTASLIRPKISSIVPIPLMATCLPSPT